MGHIKDITNQPKTQTFPSSTYEIAGTVPASQCSEARIEATNGFTLAGNNFLSLPGAFAGFALVGKTLTVSQPPPNAGIYIITGNNDDIVTIGPNFAVTFFSNQFFVKNGGELILTRDIQSFAEFISAEGFSYTVKGGKLYTNIPPHRMANACTILFNPIT